MTIFAQRLKQAREYEGYTQEEFSSMLKIPLSTYRKYEIQSKWHAEPNQELLVKMSKLLNVSVGYLLGTES